ncbi:TIGR00266 family protein [Pseudoflavonifractor capillosus]|uniref:TIGR00266 family protein n=1 Tax=Pseudoflavonifractor capillosus TaxID=106588 RepID=UPI0019562F8F|nr:TIGR00266 family protein [Pseudoflavonifractor capillosus]MBM6897783.1 TIGR00266 family protein [Pseudoflavonifractor capillosus]
MRYEITGGAFPVVICHLEDRERMITERGSMVWMSPNMSMETSGGGLGKMFSRAFSGESIFQNIYTARGQGMIAFGSSFPGKIMPLNIGPGREMVLQKNAFLASESSVELSIHFSRKLGAGFFGGEGFIMQRLSGRGVAFAEIDGELVEYTLAPGQQIVVDTGNVAGFEPTVSMDIQQVPGLKNKFLGGEGLFNTLLTGPGKVWLQTMPISNVAMAIRPFIPTGNG